MWEVRIGEGIAQRGRRQGKCGHSISGPFGVGIYIQQSGCFGISTRGNTETNITQPPQSGSVQSSYYRI